MDQADKSIFDNLTIKFVADSSVEIIENLSEKLSQHEAHEASDDDFLDFMLAAHGTAQKAMESHLDLRPKLQDVTYDNIGKQCMDFIGQP